MNHDDRDEDARFEALLERSSLGAPGARQLRERIPLAEAETILSLAALPVTPMESPEKFFRYYWPRLLRFLISQASDPGLAEKVADDTFAAAWDVWDTLITRERPDSWLFQVAIRQLRRLEARARTLDYLSEDPASIEAGLRYAAATDEWVSDHLDLVAAMQSLPRRQSEVIALKLLAGYTAKEAAQILGVAEGTARSQLSRAIEKLRVQLHASATSDLGRRKSS